MTDHATEPSSAKHAVNSVQGTEPILRTDRVSRFYRDGKVRALDEVTLEFGRGEYVAIMGPSGCGKSTLLNLLGTLDQPTSGEIFYDAKPLSTWQDLAEFRAAHVGFVFQSFHLIPVLSAIRNVQIPMFESPLSARQRDERARELLRLVQMEHRSDHRPSELSGGERQRVAIARALANSPTVLLADEPTGNLDSKTAEEIMALFDTLHHQGMTLVLVTHDATLAQRAGRIVRMRDGRIVSDR